MSKALLPGVSPTAVACNRVGCHSAVAVADAGTEQHVRRGETVAAVKQVGGHPVTQYNGLGGFL